MISMFYTIVRLFHLFIKTLRLNLIYNYIYIISFLTDNGEESELLSKPHGHSNLEQIHGPSKKVSINILFLII